MRRDELGAWSHEVAEWSTRYLETLAARPVRSRQRPGDLLDALPASPPTTAEPMETIFADFERLVPDGMTHWQHPRFFAYFPSNAAPAAMIAEQLASTLACQCMLWQTSPAATELEIRMIDWLRQAVDLPGDFRGTLQDTASSATLAAVLVMRERALEHRGNREGLAGLPRVRVYASTRTHSSIDKAMWIAGLGQENLVKIETDARHALDVDRLRERIAEDRIAGHLPAGIVVCVGGTSVGATDDVEAVCRVAQDEGLYTHVDAAWAGSAMICPEYRTLWHGVAAADSVVLNPHKWLGASMECSAHFVRDPDLLVRTLAIRPAYLDTPGRERITDFSEWSIQLGRRFRALKVWFLLRAYGLDGLRDMIRRHVNGAQALAERLRICEHFEITTEPVLSLFTFRLRPTDPRCDDATVDRLNRRFVERINDDGRIYLTPTEHDGRMVIRFTAGQFDMRDEDLDIAFETLIALGAALRAEPPGGPAEEPATAGNPRR